MSEVVNRNSSGDTQFHLRRIGPRPSKHGVANMMDFHITHYTIGRSQKQVDFVIDSNVHVQSLSISRCHARVARQSGNQHKLYDDSLNGVYVNNIKITESCILQEGDRVTFGHPSGDKLQGGTRHRQPNSEHQFVFEKCSCKNTERTAMSETSNGEKISVAQTSSERQKHLEDNRDSTKFNQSTKDYYTDGEDSCNTTSPDEKMKHPGNTVRDVELSMLLTPKREDQTNERRKTFNETASSILKDLTDIKNMLFSSSLFNHRSQGTPKKSLDCKYVTLDNCLRTDSHVTDCKPVISSSSFTQTHSDIASLPDTMQNKAAATNSSEEVSIKDGSSSNSLHNQCSRKRILSPSKHNEQATTDKGMYYSDGDSNETNQAPKKCRRIENNTCLQAKNQTPCRHTSEKLFESEASKSTAVQTAGGLRIDECAEGNLNTCDNDVGETADSSMINSEIETSFSKGNVSHTSVSTETQCFTSATNSDTEMWSGSNNTSMECEIQENLVTETIVDSETHGALNGELANTEVQDLITDTHTVAEMQNSTGIKTGNAHSIVDDTKSEFESGLSDTNLDTEVEINITDANSKTVIHRDINNENGVKFVASDANLGADLQSPLGEANADSKYQTNVIDYSEPCSVLNGSKSENEIQKEMIDDSSDLQDDDSDLSYPQDSIKDKENKTSSEDNVFKQTKFIYDTGIEENPKNCEIMKSSATSLDSSTAHKIVDDESKSFKHGLTTKASSTSDEPETIESGQNGTRNRLKRSDSVEYDVIEAGNPTVHPSCTEENLNDDIDTENEDDAEKTCSPALVLIHEATSKELGDVSLDTRIQTTIEEGSEESPLVTEKPSRTAEKARLCEAVNSKLLCVQKEENEAFVTQIENDFSLNGEGIKNKSNNVCDEIESEHESSDHSSNVSLSKDENMGLRESNSSLYRNEERDFSYAKEARAQGETKENETDDDSHSNPNPPECNPMKDSENVNNMEVNQLDISLNESMEMDTSEVETPHTSDVDADEEPVLLEKSLNREPDNHEVNAKDDPQCEQKQLNRKKCKNDKMHFTHGMDGRKRKLSNTSIGDVPHEKSCKVFIRGIGEENNDGVTSKEQDTSNVIKVEGRTLGKIFKSMVSKFFKMTEKKNKSYKLDSNATEKSLSGRAGVYRQLVMAVPEFGTEIIYDRKSQVPMEENSQSQELGTEMSCDRKSQVPMEENSQSQELGTEMSCDRKSQVPMEENSQSQELGTEMSCDRKSQVPMEENSQSQELGTEMSCDRKSQVPMEENSQSQELGTEMSCDRKSQVPMKENSRSQELGTEMSCDRKSHVPMKENPRSQGSDTELCITKTVLTDLIQTSQNGKKPCADTISEPGYKDDRKEENGSSNENATKENNVGTPFCKEKVDDRKEEIVDGSKTENGSISNENFTKENNVSAFFCKENVDDRKKEIVDGSKTEDGLKSNENATKENTVEQYPPLRNSQFFGKYSDNEDESDDDDIVNTTWQSVLGSQNIKGEKDGIEELKVSKKEKDYDQDLIIIIDSDEDGDELELKDTDKLIKDAEHENELTEDITVNVLTKDNSGLDQCEMVKNCRVKVEVLTDGVERTNPVNLDIDGNAENIPEYNLSFVKDRPTDFFPTDVANSTEEINAESENISLNVVSKNNEEKESVTPKQDKDEGFNKNSVCSTGIVNMEITVKDIEGQDGFSDTACTTSSVKENGPTVPTNNNEQETPAVIMQQKAEFDNSEVYKTGAEEIEPAEAYSGDVDKTKMEEIKENLAGEDNRDYLWSEFDEKEHSETEVEQVSHTSDDDCGDIDNDDHIESENCDEDISAQIGDVSETEEMINTSRGTFHSVSGESELDETGIDHVEHFNKRSEESNAEHDDPENVIRGHVANSDGCIEAVGEIITGPGNVEYTREIDGESDTNSYATNREEKELLEPEQKGSANSEDIQDTEVDGIGEIEEHTTNKNVFDGNNSVCSGTSEIEETMQAAFEESSQMFPALKFVESDDETRSPTIPRSENNDLNEHFDDQLSCNFSDDDDTSFPRLDMTILDTEASEYESVTETDIEDTGSKYKESLDTKQEIGDETKPFYTSDSLYDDEDDVLIFNVSDTEPDNLGQDHTNIKVESDGDEAENPFGYSREGHSKITDFTSKRKLESTEDSSCKLRRLTVIEDVNGSDKEDLVDSDVEDITKKEGFTDFKTPTLSKKPTPEVTNSQVASSSTCNDISCTQLIASSVTPDLDNFTASQVDNVTEQLEKKVKTQTLLKEGRIRAMTLIAKLKARKAVKKEENIQMEVEDQSVTNGAQSDEMLTNKERNEVIESHVERYKALIAQMKTVLDSNLALPRVQEWRNELDTIEEKVTFPKTVIAVVGKTGDGKSSLLNALLDQKNVLPTSCMQACTAVVVEVVENVDNDQYEAEIQFLERKEWFDEVKVLLNDLTGVDGKLRNRQPDPSSDTFASYCKIKAVYGKIDKYDKLVMHMSVTRWLGKKKHLKSSRPSEFRGMVERYIETQDSASGDQFWPIVKHVRLSIPNCDVCSSGAALIDLPGVRDSNAARDRIAKEYIKNCSAVWVVSSIHRAIDDKIAKDLLGENFRRQLLMDGQYGSVTFICTKTDILVPSELIRPLKLEKETEDHVYGIQDAEAEKTGFERDEKNCTREIDELEKSVEEIRKETREVREYLDEINSLIDPNDPEKEDEEVSNIFQDYLAELHLKENEMERMELRIGELNLTQQYTARKISQLETILAISRRMLSAICAHERNKYSEKRIKSDFRAGMKEMKRRAGLSSDDYEEFDDDDSEGDDDVGSRAENLRVFCCSSTEYQKMMHLLDGSPQVFEDIEDTQIPELRRYVHKITHVRRQVALERLVHSLGGFVFDVKSYVTEYGQEDTCKWETAQKSIEKQIESLGDHLEPVLDDLSSAIDAVFDRQIKPKMNEGTAAAVNEANATCAKWGSKKVQKKDGNFSSFPFTTYKAIVQRQGQYSSPTFGSINFNEELSEPVYRSMTIAWDRAFSGSLWKILEDTKQELLAKLNEFVLGLGKTLYLLGMPKDRLKRVGAQFLSSTGNKLDELLQQLKDVITTRQRDISRIITPHVRESLVEPYHLATEEHGPGMFARMKNHMASGIDRGRFIMFDEATRKLMDNLDELKNLIVQNMREVCNRLIKGLRAALEPLWKVSGTSNPFTDDILPALTTICSEMENIYTLTGLQNTDDHSDDHSGETVSTSDEPVNSTCQNDETQSSDGETNMKDCVEFSKTPLQSGGLLDDGIQHVQHIKTENTYIRKSLIMPPARATGCVTEKTWTSDNYQTNKPFMSIKSSSSCMASDFISERVDRRVLRETENTSVVETDKGSRKSLSLTQTRTFRTSLSQQTCALNVSLQPVVRIKEEPVESDARCRTKLRRGKYLGFIDLTLDD